MANSRQSLLLILALAGILFAGCGSDQGRKAAKANVGDRVVVTALTSAAAVEPGESFTVMWRFDVADGWHLYSNSRNDSGFPPSVKLDLPTGWQAGPLLWPTPERHLSPGEILDHVYHGQLFLLQDLTLPARADIGQTVTVPARLDWLVCREECVPGKAQMDLKVTIAAKGRPSVDAPLVTTARAALPQLMPADGCDIRWGDSSVTLVVPEAEHLEFYPAGDCALLLDIIADGAVDADRLILRLRATDGHLGPLKGILNQKIHGGSVRNWLIDAQPGG